MNAIFSGNLLRLDFFDSFLGNAKKNDDELNENYQTLLYRLLKAITFYQAK